MAKNKKEKESVDVESIKEVKPEIEEITITAKRIEDCEWCYQFDDDDAEVFAWTDSETKEDEDPKVIFTISNLENSYITFKNESSGKSFKIFARQISEKGIELRNKQKESLKNLQNGSENKETEA